MRIEKRTMNWLPKLSAYQEMQQAREKRQVANERVAISASNASNMIGSGIANATESYNLTLRIAAARVQAGVNVKPKG
jgi:hypothetical protein